MVTNIIRKIGLAAFIFLWIQVSNASALTIIARSIGGAVPASAAGGGNLDDIVNTAARIWESAYSDPVVLTLYYGWAQVGDAGTHTLQEIDSQGRETVGTILFDNSGSVSFYLDPTPASNEEYLSRTEEYQDFGSGPMNASRIFGHPTGDAVGRLDLLSVALHEIGHALGLSDANPSFVRQSPQGLLYITGDYPFAGAAIPMAYNNSGIVPHFDASETVYGSLMSGINEDERRMPSELDVLANAQVSRFAIAALDPEQAYQESIALSRGLSAINGTRLGSARDRGASRGTAFEPLPFVRSQRAR